MSFLLANKTAKKGNFQKLFFQSDYVIAVNIANITDKQKVYK